MTRMASASQSTMSAGGKQERSRVDDVGRGRVDSMGGGGVEGWGRGLQG